MGVQQFQETSQLQAERRSWEQESHCNEQCKASASDILLNAVKIHAIGHVSEMVEIRRLQLMLMVPWQKLDCSPAAATSPLLLQLVERLAENVLERGVESDGMESG